MKELRFSAASRQRDLENVLALLTEALEETAEGRDASQDLIAQARSLRIQELNSAALSTERNERIFTQIEDAVAMSLEPLDAMFRAAGLPTDSIFGYGAPWLFGPRRAFDTDHLFHVKRHARPRVTARQ